MLTPSCARARHVLSCAQLDSIYAAAHHLLRLDQRGRVFVCLKAGATTAHVLQAVLHAASLESDGSFRTAHRAQKATWQATLRGVRTLDVTDPADGLSARRPELSETADGGLGVEEALALRASLAFVESQWEAFTAALEQSGWTAATERMRVEHFGGALRVRIGRAE
jgi:hypothetical protein